MNDPYSNQAARPLLYSEWRRQNSGTRTDYNEYLRAMRMGTDPVTAMIVNKLYGDVTQDEALAAAEIISKLSPKPEEPEKPAERLYARQEVLDAIGTAANMATQAHEYESSETIAADDAVNLTVHAAGYLLDHPDASLEEIILTCYDDVTLDEGDFEDDELTYRLTGSSMPEKGTPAWNAALVRKVLGWLA
jgi:hypothetical protein